MPGDTRPRIYWANAMFNEADRNFNAQCAEVLRKAGYRVLLPQEASVNELSAPSSQDVFRTDTRLILDSDLLVACIDQETIDSGVACEIGIALAYGVPIIGLYTDIRQRRRGRGRMYKNLYVVGAIAALGQIVSHLEDLLPAVRKCLPSAELGPSVRKSEKAIIQHYNSIAPRYSQFVQRLETWYTPGWSATQVVDRWIRFMSPTRVIEFGCGTGDLCSYISRSHPGVCCVGYDQSGAMIRLARAAHAGFDCTFTSSWLEVERQARKEPFDVALAFFALHDLCTPEQAVSLLAQSLRSDGVILIADLSTSDLPRLTDLLRRELLRPLNVPDRRIDPLRITGFARASNSAVIDCGIAMPLIDFPCANDIDEYFEVFGIYRGMDLPLGLGGFGASVDRARTRQVLETQSYPFSDQRAFIICALKKRHNTAVS